MTSTALAGLLLVSFAAAADLPFDVNEREIKIVLLDDRSAVLFPIRNPSGQPVNTSLGLEWLTPGGVVAASRSQALSIPPGESRPVVDFPLPAGRKEDPVWYRLRYRFRAQGAQGGGTLSIANGAAHAFELRVSAPPRMRPGAPFSARVNARHATSGAPVEGVFVHGSLELEAGKLEARAISDSSGAAVLSFEIPGDAEGDETELAVEGVLGDFRQSTNTDVQVDRGVQVRIDTDKPLYQPGQTMHIRLLALKSSGKAAANLPLGLRINDPEDTGAHISHVETNRFGVAAADWQIPDNIRLGDYSIRTAADGEDAEARASRTIKISRYELPNFTVTAKPDRPYYLPGENAVIEVHADYLFGKPVPRGHVRVVLETRREWDYRLQRWDIEEGMSREGIADSSGRFAAKLDLSSLHAGLADKFKDATFTAYVRDPASGRTEQRRFDLRITSEPIHLYLTGSRDYKSLYVSASYADGRPASCRIRVNGGATVTANSYGVARLAIPDDAESVELAAEDGRGLRGRLEEQIYRSDSDSAKLHIQTDRTLYRPGEPVRVTIISSEPVRAAALEVLKDEELLDSRWLDLSSGKAQVGLPWRDVFTHEITIGVALGGRYDESASRTVLFPADRDLRVSVRTDQATYRPGEEAVASFTALSPSGKPVAAALGVAVVDAAVGERARMDSEQSSFAASWMQYCGGACALAGVTRRDLYRLDVSKPFADDLDLLAEAMLAQDSYWPNVERSVNYGEDLPIRFAPLFADQFKPLVKLLNGKYEKDYHHPRDMAALKEDFGAAGTEFETLHDPWEQPYRAVFDTVERFDRVVLLSAGPDKRFGTGDDVAALTVARASFKPYRDQIGAALRALPAFPSTEPGTRSALRDAGIRVEELKDPWGTTYAFQFGILGIRSVLRFRSAGPDRAFGTADDFEAGDLSGDYFTEVRAKLAKIVDAQTSFPADDGAWNRLLRSAGLFPLRDLWGTDIYPVFQHQSRYTDLKRYYMAAKYGGKAQQRTEVLPATERFYALYLRSAGPDRKAGTADDFDLAAYSRTVKVEKSEKPGVPAPKTSGVPAGNTGSVMGMITDQTGAVIPHATVRAVRAGADQTSVVEYRTQSDEDGLYRISGLLPGFYDVRIESPGFQMFLVTRVPVSRTRSTVLDATLVVGTVSESISVAAPAPSILATESASVSGVVRQTTPRVREYFPETLLWAPSLEMDADGRTQVKFRLADNIATWKVDAIASTEDGEIGTVAADLRAFQPFFIDHAPPRVLTQGDRIDLPTTVRNYLDREERVKVSLRPEKWFEIEGSNRRDVRIGSGTSVNAVFPIRVSAAVADGKQRVTAQGAGPADAIEKPVTVHPDGHEVATTVNGVMTDSSDLEIAVPERSIAGSVRAELKIYPNLVSHVVDGIEGILQRPYGCAEQTISSAYPSLILLRYIERLGAGDIPVREKAQRYLQSGLDRLMGYRGEDGSFSYWGRGGGDVTLTAYALTFLTHAKEFAVVDDDLIEQAQEWLSKRQSKDGGWASDGSRRAPCQTAVAALALAGADAGEPAAHALRYLSAEAGRIDEPYLIAATALVAQSLQQAGAAEDMLAHLRRAARRENGMAYWNVETNTPFYGWGLAGRLETTALALTALVRANQPSDRPLIDSGLLFLLRNKDRYGVWHSTQATVKVLEAILTASGDPAAAGPAGPAEVLVNGKAAASVPMPGVRELTGPMRVDLSPFLSRGVNRIAVRRPEGRDPAQVQVAASYYVPWTAAPASPEKTPLRFQVTFDRTAVRPGDEIRCRVEAERVGFRGYGMMVAEIGLPPGADVDRHSLDDAMKASKYGLGQYDILPDRVLVYLWPSAGGANFNFRFRPRMAMDAKSAPSALYDYYNPDARLAIRPVRFRVQVAQPGTPAPKVVSKR